MRTDSSEGKFSFEISLSVLNHLGRNLYRSIITVLGEAISNAWDADAKNVWIQIDKEGNVFTIKDDGIGMDAEDFQTKFLKIGYSKRTAGGAKSPAMRPFIGAKGIGKLALLSCAKRISVFTRKVPGEYVGGVIDNSGLDEAITNDLTPDKYPLEALDPKLIEGLKVGHDHGTIIVFETVKDQIRNSAAHIKKMLALTFRFSIIDKDFSIHVNGERVSVGDLKDLTDATEFAWVINGYNDEFIDAFTALKRSKFALATTLDVKGFVASVKKPKNLKIVGAEDRATIDLFANGRLRERNILRHIPTQRIVESYIYGQIHFDSLDAGGGDPFTTSREGIVEGDLAFQALLNYLKVDALPQIFDDWDKYRLQQGEEGDEENTRKSRKERKARDLYSATREDYEPSKNDPAKGQVDEWLNSLQDDAEFNLSSYADCFLSENLVRKYLRKKNAPLSEGVMKEAKEWREREAKSKGKANLSFEIRESDDDLNYLGMDALAVSVEGKKDPGGVQSLWSDAIAYAPVRNVVGHTGLLTDNAKSHLRLTYENIKARIRKLVSVQQS